jgi:hypothetical protein
VVVVVVQASIYDERWTTCTRLLRSGGGGSGKHVGWTVNDLYKDIDELWWWWLFRLACGMIGERTVQGYWGVVVVFFQASMRRERWTACTRLLRIGSGGCSGYHVGWAVNDAYKVAEEWWWWLFRLACGMNGERRVQGYWIVVVMVVQARMLDELWTTCTRLSRSRSGGGCSVKHVEWAVNDIYKVIVE